MNLLLVEDDSKRWRTVLGAVIFAHVLLLPIFYALASNVQQLKPELPDVCIEFIAEQPPPPPVAPPVVPAAQSPIKKVVDLPQLPQRSVQHKTQVVSHEKIAVANTVPTPRMQPLEKPTPVVAALPVTKSPAVVQSEEPSAEQSSATPSQPSTHGIASRSPSASDDQPSSKQAGTEAASSHKVESAHERKSERAADGSIGEWQGKILAKLHARKRYPPEARHAKQEGCCCVKFCMNRKGRVLDACVHKSSGCESLDKESVALIYRAEPFPTPPQAMDGERIELVVPVDFSLSRM